LNNNQWNFPAVPTYLAPSDATLPADGQQTSWGNMGALSFAVNGWITGWVPSSFEPWIPGGSTLFPKARIPQSIRDGTSNTILFFERYTVCTGNGTPGSFPPGAGSEVFWFWADYEWGVPWYPWPTGNAATGGTDTPPPATPIIDLRPQWAPTDVNCNCNRLQSYSDGGMMVGLGDGSVRMVSSAVTAQTWFYAMNPSDGQLLGPDW
jgi:Protein of unknown function (DUF1559)